MSNSITIEIGSDMSVRMLAFARAYDGGEQVGQDVPLTWGRHGANMTLHASQSALIRSARRDLGYGGRKWRVADVATERDGSLTVTVERRA